MTARRRDRGRTTPARSVERVCVHGTESDILTREAGERLAEVLPSGQFVSIEGAGHTVQGDNPHSLGEALEQFLRQPGY